MLRQLFTDGGCILANPSTIAGTWAYRIVENEKIVKQNCGVVTPFQLGIKAISNNVSELMAILAGFHDLPNDWNGTVFSDSAIALNRIFGVSPWNNVPDVLVKDYARQRSRFVNWGQIEHIQLDGHPTAYQLERGYGRHGNLVSIHNKWCDEACAKIGARWAESR